VSRWFSRPTYGIFAVFLALVATACQPLPHPFRPDDKDAGANGLLELEDTAGIFIVGIDNAQPEVSQTIAAGLVEALHDLDIPASTHTANRESLVLQCAVVDAGDGRDLVLRWELIAADGVVAGLFEQRVAAASWRRGTPRIAKQVVADAAPRIAALVRDVTDIPRPLPAVFVERVSGVEGGARLSSAVRRALEGADIRVVDDVADDTLLVLGSVYREPRGEEELVEVSWAVIEPDGTEVGRIEQSNVIPLGFIERRWGEVAAAIAAAGAEGIAALLRSTRGSGNK